MRRQEYVLHHILDIDLRSTEPRGPPCHIPRVKPVDLRDRGNLRPGRRTGNG